MNDRIHLNEHDGKRTATFHCPGCGYAHAVALDGENAWTWNGDLIAPTFTPSILVESHPTLINVELEGDALTAPENITASPRCHSYVTDGRITFLADSTHARANTIMEIAPWPTPEAD